MGVPGSGVCRGRSSVVEPVKYSLLLFVKFDFAPSRHQGRPYMEPDIVSKALISLRSILTGEATRGNVGQNEAGSLELLHFESITRGNYLVNTRNIYEIVAK